MRKIYKTGNEQMKFQGDVSIVAVPDSHVKNLTFRPLSKTGYTVAVGETTGNKHVVLAERGSILEMSEDARGVFIRVKKGFGSITGHLEHEPFVKELSPLDGQVWFVGRKREYDPIKKWRQVQD